MNFWVCFRSSFDHSHISKGEVYILRPNKSQNFLCSESKQMQIPETARNCLHFLELICRFGHIDWKEVQAFVPSYLFDNYPD